MKKYSRLFMFLAVALLMLTTSPVMAEKDEAFKLQREAFNASIKSEREAFKAKMETERQAFLEKLKTERETFKTEIEKQKADFKLAKTEKKQEFLGKAQAMIAQRFEMAIQNLERIQAKVAEAIEKLETDGKDTSDATDALDLSKSKLADAKTKLAAIKALLPDSGEKITPEVFAEVKISAREAKDLLKESRSYLVTAIKEVGELRGEDDDEGAE
jgi:hypothetical protein